MAGQGKASPDDRGRNAQTPWSMPWSGWKDVLLRTAKESGKDNVGLVAAGVAFYAFLSLVPLLGALVLTYGFIADPHTVVQNMQSLTRVLPADAAKLIGDQLLGVVKTSGGKKGIGIIAALGIAIFGARNAAGSLIIALNIAYEEEEKRSFVRVTLLALMMTAAGIVAALLAMLAFSVLGFLEALLPNTAGIVLIVTKLLSYALMLAAAAAAAATLYRYAPSRDRARWTWLTPGSLFSALGWLILTVGFGIYVANFGSYGKTYGSLASVVVLLTWIYLSSYVFLFGAELNSEFEHQTQADTTRGAPKPLGGRGAWSADHVASGADDAGKEGEQSPAGGDTATGHEPRTAGAKPGEPVPAGRPRIVEDKDHPYLASRLTARSARIAGLPKIGVVGSVLSTAGLSLLRRKGRAPAGAVLLGTAGLLAWLRRER
ncbi:YihY/virulence factor BrkB family protein [Sphingomonas ginkgonis]|uniref:YihY/virulence factor BrkB family protein n=1 Tax=Sphingomonas ginkgonis TaxID=2315330 RepID=A0A429V9R1_9SPHN|nr:YihY/virulence factor BrkB family protein [Sphingomonas ginkgonis]RST30723.1 YihY/virulence factor BrkB family protein [Sphingomonas ginkgonis]